MGCGGEHNAVEWPSVAASLSTWDVRKNPAMLV